MDADLLENANLKHLDTLKEEMTSRSAIIFPFPGARLMLAEAFAQELKDEIKRSMPSRAAGQPRI